MATLDQDDLDAIAALIAANNATLVDAVWDEVLTGASHNVATSAGRRLRALADTVILKDGDAVAADNAGSINGTNGLGRIKLQPDVGTVCVGQAVRVAGQVRYIEAYDAGTQYATVDSQWCSIPQVGDEYTIFNLRNALIQRINSAGEGTIAYPIAKLWELLEDSSGWRYTAKALEATPAESIVVGPVQAEVPPRSVETFLRVYRGETVNQIVSVVESDGTTPVDLSGKSLEIVFEGYLGTDLAVIATANITISGDDNNVVTFAYPSAVTATVGRYYWSLRDDAAPSQVYLNGEVEVLRAAVNDP